MRRPRLIASLLIFLLVVVGGGAVIYKFFLSDGKQSDGGGGSNKTGSEKGVTKSGKGGVPPKPEGEDGKGKDEGDVDPEGGSSPIDPTLAQLDPEGGSSPIDPTLAQLDPEGGSSPIDPTLAQLINQIPPNRDVCNTKKFYNEIKSTEIKSVTAHVSDSFINSCTTSDTSDKNKLNCSLKQCYESQDDFIVPEYFDKDIGTILGNLISTGTEPLFRLENSMSMFEYIDGYDIHHHEDVLGGVYAKYLQEVFENDEDRELASTLEWTLRKILRTLKDERIEERLNSLRGLFKEAHGMYDNVFDGKTKSVFKIDKGKKKDKIGGPVGQALSYISDRYFKNSEIFEIRGEKAYFIILNDIFSNDTTLAKDLLLVLYFHKHGMNNKIRENMKNDLKAENKCNLPECGFDQLFGSLFDYCMDLFPMKLKIMNEQFIDVIKKFLPSENITKLNIETRNTWYTEEDSKKLFKIYGDSLSHVAIGNENSYIDLRMIVKTQTWFNDLDLDLKDENKKIMGLPHLGQPVTTIDDLIRFDNVQWWYIPPAYVVSFVSKKTHKDNKINNALNALSNYTTFYYSLVPLVKGFVTKHHEHFTFFKMDEPCLNKFFKNEQFKTDMGIPYIEYYVEGASENLILFTACYDEYLSDINISKDYPKEVNILKQLFILRYTTHMKSLDKSNPLVSVPLYHNKMFFNVFQCDKNGGDYWGDRCFTYKYMK
eukprot:GHVR01185854.1.p1 GENE.GHVR01185854.1~~GHVR01185854.1.p1  ORF type:complete len:710 (+),score=118.29 GHVR01185854.1:43-2172(+)